MANLPSSNLDGLSMYVCMVIRNGCKSKTLHVSACSFGLKQMSGSLVHSFQEGEARLCRCPLCLALIRLGRTITDPTVSTDFFVQWVRRVQLLGVEAQDRAEFDRVQPPEARGAPPPFPLPPGVPSGSGIPVPPPVTPWDGSREVREPAESSTRREKDNREKKESRHKDRGKDWRKDEEEKQTGGKEKKGRPPKSHKETSEGAAKRNPASGSRPSRSRSRTRKKEKRSPAQRERTPDRVRREKATPARLIPVKKEEESEEGYWVEESESEEVAEDPVVPEERPKPPEPPYPPPGANPVLPGAHTLPRPLSTPDRDRPALPRRREVPEREERPRNWREGPKKKRRKPKGKKKRERQADINRAGGLRNWYASQNRS